MPRVGCLHTIHRQRPDGVDTDLVHSLLLFLFLRCGSGSNRCYAHSRSFLDGLHWRSHCSLRAEMALARSLITGHTPAQSSYSVGCAPPSSRNVWLVDAMLLTRWLLTECRRRAEGNTFDFKNGTQSTPISPVRVHCGMINFGGSPPRRVSSVARPSETGQAPSLHDRRFTPDFRQENKRHLPAHASTLST